MSVLTINGATEGTPEDVERRTWALACTDVFGRPYELRITAYRGPTPGIGIQSPTGEYGFVDVNHVRDLSYVLNEAKRFIGLGARTCTRNI